MTIDIESVLDTLKDGRTPKTQRSLEGLNTVLKAILIQEDVTSQSPQ